MERMNTDETPLGGRSTVTVWN